MADVIQTISRDGGTSATIALTVDLDDEVWRLHVDDGTDGTFAGMDPQCESCGHRVGYLHCDVPSTMEEAYTAAFIPCVEHEPSGRVYCLDCVRSGQAEEREADRADD